MGGRRRLSAGLQRLYPDHREVEAVAHRRLFSALEAELGPFTPLARLEAWRLAALGVEFTLATRALAVTRREREKGRGRRPGPRLIERYARRARLANLSYSQGLDRLRAMVAQKANGHDLAERFAQVHQERHGG
jgi:hypothetical protein